MTYKKITADTNDVFSGAAVRIHQVVLFGGSDTATALFENDATTAGTNDFAKLEAVASSRNYISWGEQGLTVNYVSVTLTGTSPILYIYYS